MTKKQTIIYSQCKHASLDVFDSVTIKGEYIAVAVEQKEKKNNRNHLELKE